MHPEHLRLPTSGLDGYLRSVAVAVHVPVLAVWSDVRPPATAYLPLSQRSPECPDRDLLLVWGEQDGWLIAADTAPPIVLAYLGQDILPGPDTVRRFVADMVAGRHPGQLQPPGFHGVGDHDDLTSRLADLDDDIEERVVGASDRQPYFEQFRHEMTAGTCIGETPISRVAGVLPLPLMCHSSRLSGGLDARARVGARVSGKGCPAAHTSTGHNSQLSGASTLVHVSVPGPALAVSVPAPPLMSSENASPMGRRCSLPNWESP